MGMITFVRGPRAGLIVSGVIQSVASSTSQNTGSAPRPRTHSAPATNDNEGIMTSSPGPTPRATKPSCNAAVQLFTAIACRTPDIATKVLSNSLTLGPVVIQPRVMDSVTESISSCSINGL